MARLVWRANARADLDRHFRFLWEKDEKAADRAVDEILNAIALLKSFPRFGRPILDGSGHRELVVGFGAGAYIVRYALKDENTVIVLRIWHSRENRGG
jgi:plasmid stabilization system protein ParE